MILECQDKGAVESLQDWQEELQEMHREKNGRSFRYPAWLDLVLEDTTCDLQSTLSSTERVGYGFRQVDFHPRFGLQHLVLAQLQAGTRSRSWLRAPGGGRGSDRRGWDEDQSDQPWGVAEKEAEGLHQDPCGSRYQDQAGGEHGGD